MSRKEESEAREQQQQADDTITWSALSRRIAGGQVIPIISSAALSDQIFDMDSDNILGIDLLKPNPMGWSIDGWWRSYLPVSNSDPMGWSIEDQLAQEWAKSDEVKFPLNEQHWLPRVALYDRVVNHGTDEEAKTRYITWLKTYLLDSAEKSKVADIDTINDLRDDIDYNSFSDIADDLGLPRRTEDSKSSAELLAKLQLPIYVTTSPFDFLERAIREDNRTPFTQVCNWSKVPTYVNPEILEMDSDFSPSPTNPLVFHLFGLEPFPESIVLHEDDYLNFLSAVLQDSNNELVPSYLLQSIAQSDLILLGYRLRDLELRAMFRGLIEKVPARIRKLNLAIHVSPPNNLGDEVNSKIRQYLQEYFQGYFHKSEFKVSWNSPQGFMNKLAKEYDQWKRGNKDRRQ